MTEILPETSIVKPQALKTMKNLISALWLPGLPSCRLETGQANRFERASMVERPTVVLKSSRNGRLRGRPSLRTGQADHAIGSLNDSSTGGTFVKSGMSPSNKVG